MLILCGPNHLVVCENALVADGFWSRARGLLFRPPLGQKAGLWIEPCNSVHTMFMRWPIDVVFIDKNCEVIEIIPHMRPWRVSRIVSGAKAVLELPAGTAAQISLRPGDSVELFRTPGFRSGNRPVPTVVDNQPVPVFQKSQKP